MDRETLNLGLIEALGCSSSTGRISFVDNDGVVRVAVENLRQLERSLEKEGQHLEDLVAGMHRKCFSVPLSADPVADPHFISFESAPGSHILMANSPHTDGDVQVLDLRVAAIASVSIQGVAYKSYFAALEICREFGGEQSMFQMGLYLVEKASGQLSFCEAENVRVRGPGARGMLRRIVFEFAGSLPNISYGPEILQRKLLQPDKTIYLSRILEALGSDASRVSLDGYFQKLRDISSYLQGANIEERTKFEHNFDPAIKGLLHRVQLCRSNLSRLPFTEHRNTEYAVETYRKPPGYRREEELGRRLCSMADGQRIFLEECEQYLNWLYMEAGLTRRHFDLAPFHEQYGPAAVPFVDLRYVTILRARDNQPLVMTHWRIRHDQAGQPLPRNHHVDRLQFWNQRSDFVCLEEGKDFRAGIEQVKDISKAVAARAHGIDANTLSTLVQQLAALDVLLVYEQRV